MTGKPRSQVRPHPFTADPAIPADHVGRRRCAACGLMGKPGDVHHRDTRPPGPPRPLPAAFVEAAQARDAAILGEKEDLE